MKPSEKCIEKTKQSLSALGQIESRTQFGGYSLSVEKIVFALVSDGELYLRASEPMQHYRRHRHLQPYIFYKRGQSLHLKYFRVDNVLWHQHETLLELSRGSLNEARACRASASSRHRLKDLPNLSLNIELLLRETGITTANQLAKLGAKESWLRLKACNSHLGLNTLYALQGAIMGKHLQVLPAPLKAELTSWYQAYLQRVHGPHPAAKTGQ
ncbi:TfoX/Sxy family DNA transformation protein [Tatumella saanichensis]|uniref:TfoX/Sxy family DNA transformation protein n=1 Tax=Tatumella saanichensis TaxID=480813 RepID=UPI0004A21879|nr:TfoX/Sxy family DNA transformation protein [Tatumella saanichensis]